LPFKADGGQSVLGAFQNGKCFLRCEGKTPGEIKAALKAEADSIRSEDEKVCRSSVKTPDAFKARVGILTHCNAGTIATAKYGTALAPVYLGQQAGYHFNSICRRNPTAAQERPADVLGADGKRGGVTLICDNMASFVLKEGLIQGGSRGMRPGGCERRHGKQDRHIGRGHPGKIISNPLLCLLAAFDGRSACASVRIFHRAESPRR
jgi:hypothetical protein